MSSSSNVFPERKRLSNVSISPLSSDVLYVRIRRMSGEEDVSQLASTSRQVSRKPVFDKNKNNDLSKSTMTDSQETTTAASQNFSKDFVEIVSPAERHTAHDPSPAERHTAHDPSPCLKHAAENFSRKACDIHSEKISLCNNCSKSMLSYIFLVQDFLDSLAREIIGCETQQCLQCARQEIRNTIVKSDFVEPSSVESTFQKHPDNSSNVDSTSRKLPHHKSSGSRQKDVSHERRSGNKMFKEKSHHKVSKKNEDYQAVASSSTNQSNVNIQKQRQTAFIYSESPSNKYPTKAQDIPRTSDDKRVLVEHSSSENKQQTSEISDNLNQQWTSAGNQNVNQPVARNEIKWSSPKENTFDKYRDTVQYSEDNTTQPLNYYQQTNEQSINIPEFRTLKERVQPNYQHPPPAVPDHHSQTDPNSNFSPSLYKDDLDGIISTLSTTEREIYDSARDRAGRESFIETPERLVVPSDNSITSEAFVTSCRNNAEAMGCLVLGTSLLLCRTSRTLCVLVSEGVSMAFRNAFSSVFQVVQLVRSLDSLGTTKLALLEQPELGVTFEKLNIWRLIQFTKCVYLNPDTLVIQNCDELFCREELSAVPDIGWPDCFNSGVFVYSPSVHTFWQLLEFAEKQGSYDGGDQGLLNSYFNSWSSDISKKLSFIYNLMANVSYTYSPAFRQFGRDVKIVQFHGSFKPWHVKFFTKTGQISPSSPVHPTYVQFVHIWINIFRITVLRLLSQEIQSYAASQEVINAVEMLRFFPLPTESESDFFLTPPSVRLRLAEKKLNKPGNLAVTEARRRKSAEYFRYTITEEETPERVLHEKEKSESDNPEETKTTASASDEPETKENTEESVLETDEVFKESDTVEEEEKEKSEKEKDENAIPGSEIGDYQGMKAWEQGRMDYEGSARSDNIIKRLEFLMNPKPK